jgi:hypothetical protein
MTEHGETSQIPVTLGWTLPQGQGSLNSSSEPPVPTWGPRPDYEAILKALQEWSEEASRILNESASLVGEVERLTKRVENLEGMVREMQGDDVEGELEELDLGEDAE